MFTTFAGAPPRSPSTLSRSRRNQVARACDWCRVHRIKCDNNFPCYNCQNRGGQCSNEWTSEVRTLPHAFRYLSRNLTERMWSDRLTSFREIERLRLRVKELEEQAQKHDHSSSFATSPTSSPAVIDPLGEHGGSRKYWEGIYTRAAQSHQTQYYGPASSFYFISRMSSYLGTALQQPHFDHHMQPNSASRSFASPTSLKRDNLEETSIPTDGSTNGDYLTATQEDYFLDLFWQSYHCTLQIIEEAAFREHYKSLWLTSGTSRKPSALVDIVLALCMQYGVASVPRSNAATEPKLDVDSSDATIAGRWLYHRSQTLLACELENPSNTTLQCYIFSVYYLCSASFQNMAYSTLALAVRTAHILGLHLEPPADMPRNQRELRKRLWWTLYTLESKTCMKLGRPWSAHISQVSCSLPADDQELALLSGSNCASAQDVTGHTYSLQNTKLVLAARAIYIAFLDKCADILGAKDGTTLYSDPQTLEDCAEFLLSSVKCLQIWLQNLPKALKTKRKGTGEPFSTDRSPLEMELFAPLWLQRQRLLLELLYHNLTMNLYRPFICFSTESSSCLPFAKGNAISCVNHAIAITHIMDQMLTETKMLSGWHEAFQWQWNATLSMIGFILAYPLDPSTPSTRKAIDSAISVFQEFGNNFAIAASAAKVTRDLTFKADLLIDRFQGNLITPNPPSSNIVETLRISSSPNPSNTRDDSTGIGSQPDEGSFALIQNAVAGSMDLAFTVDSFNTLEPLWPASVNMSGLWNFTQD